MRRDEALREGLTVMEINNKNFWGVALLLAVVMSVTRIGHFGEAGGPPDASWAVFFLAGMWLRSYKLFPAFFALAWIADLTAFALGTPTDCYSPAYFFLIPAYAALWFAGSWVAREDFRPLQFGLAVVGSAATTFAIANLGMFWLAPPSSAVGIVEYAASVVGYFPGYLLTMSVYVAGAVALALALRFKRLASE